jgi:hypothetical protein
MAKVSAHGTEIGTVHFTTKAKRYMSDGTVLKNIGFGWKISGKVKAGFTPEQAFQAQADKSRAFRAENPAYAAYRAALHDMAGMSKRWKLHAAIEMMPDDADGVWSECCDGYCDNVHADIDEVSELCRLYLAARSEMNEKRKAKA